MLEAAMPVDNFGEGTGTTGLETQYDATLHAETLANL